MQRPIAPKKREAPSSGRRPLVSPASQAATAPKMPGAPDQKSGRVMIASAPNTIGPDPRPACRPYQRQSGKHADDQRGGAGDTDRDDLLDRTVAPEGILVRDEHRAGRNRDYREHTKAVDPADQDGCGRDSAPHGLADFVDRCHVAPGLLARPSGLDTAWQGLMTRRPTPSVSPGGGVGRQLRVRTESPRVRPATGAAHSAPAKVTNAQLDGPRADPSTGPVLTSALASRRREATGSSASNDADAASGQSV
jgi:hypothetical protein